MKQQTALVLTAFAVAPLVAAVHTSDDGGAAAAASRPASAPAPAKPGPSAEERRAQLALEISRLGEMRRALEQGDAVDLEELPRAAPTTAVEADRKTKTIRRRLEELENEWASAREARDRAVAAAQIRILQMTRVGPPLPAEPLPHPLAEPDALRLGRLMLERGEFEKAAATLARASGAEARFLEARALDSANHVDEARAGYVRALEAALGDPALVATIERAQRDLGWKIEFGVPEELGATVRANAAARQARGAGRSSP